MPSRQPINKSGRRHLLARKPRPEPEQPGLSLPLSALKRQMEFYLLDAELRHLSPRTHEARQLATGKLIWFMEKKRLDYNADTLRSFFLYLSKGHEEAEGRWDSGITEGVSVRTVRTYYLRLKAFTMWLVQRKLLAETILDFSPPREPDDQIQPFTSAQISALLHAADKSVDAKRNRAILLMLLDTGMRVSELCNFTWNQLDLPGKWIHLEGKGRKKRSVRIGRRTTVALRQYVEDEARTRRQLDPSGFEDAPEGNQPVFQAWAADGLRCQPMTRNGVLQLIHRLGRAAKIESVRCSPHTFRHTFAIWFLRNGGNEFTLQTILGQTELRTTRRYVAIAKADVEKQHQQYSPADRMKLN